MNDYTQSKDIEIMAIDLAKSSFQLHGVNHSGHKVVAKKLTRKRLKAFMIKLSSCLVIMEACGSAHYWGRLFQSYGHQVKLIAPQFVKPFVKSNKNDAADAEAIAEAGQRPSMRFVSIKSVAQQEALALHRVRSQAVKNRTALVNQVRGFLLERGIEIPRGREHVRKHLAEIVGDQDNDIGIRFRHLLQDLYDDLVALDARIERYNKEFSISAQECESIQRLMSIPGVGPQTASAIVASIGDITLFKNARELAAFLGLVPRQSSTGGRPTLLGISKRGDVYLRTLLIHGARSVLQRVEKKSDAVSQWANNLVQRRGKNIAAVALANKMARVVYALLSKEENYHAPA